MEKPDTAKNCQILDIKAVFYTCLQTKQGKLKQERKSKMRNHYLFGTAVTLIATKYASVHGHPQRSTHAGLHVTSVYKQSNISTNRNHYQAAELHVLHIKFVLQSGRIVFMEGVYSLFVLSVVTHISNITCKKMPYTRISNFIEQNPREADSQLVKKLFFSLNSLPCSQYPTTGPYPEPPESSLCPRTLFL